PSFATSRFAHLQVKTGPAWLGLLIGAAIAIVGIAIAYRIWVREPAIATRLSTSLSPVHRFLVNKWYFDELIDVLVVRPALWIGRVTDSVLERLLVTGIVTGGTVSVVRAGSAAVRRAQSGFVRYYAAALVVGISAMALYFLISST